MRCYLRNRYFITNMSSKFVGYADGFHFLPTPACPRARFRVLNFTNFTNRDISVSTWKITTRRFVRWGVPNLVEQTSVSIASASSPVNLFFGVGGGPEFIGANERFDRIGQTSVYLFPSFGF